MKMFRIECKTTGSIIETDMNNWRKAVWIIKDVAKGDGVKITTKNADIINGAKEGYEDDFVKASCIPGDWRC
jgi:hypothetical protein